MSTKNETDLIDVTDFYNLLCLENGFKARGERFIVPRAKWQLWQATLLKEYLSDDTTHNSEDPKG